MRPWSSRRSSALGGIDILINNAGVLSLGPIDDFKLADFDRTIAINVRAVFVATQAAVRHMKEGGRIINIGSCNAERGLEENRDDQNGDDVDHLDHGIDRGT